MDDMHELTEKLKVLEVKLYNAKLELKTTNSKLNVAYQYEEDLNQRQIAAKKSTEELRIEFFQKSSAISEMYGEMKAIFDIHTGNFHRNVEIINQ